MIFGLYLAKDVPFKTVYLHGLVNDAKGKKMSKSKGNVINPIDLTEKYGTDGLRMGLVVGNTPGNAFSLSEDKIKGYKHFANKIWNITRFVMSSAEETTTTQLLPEDQKLIDTLQTLVADVTKDIDEYRFYMAAEKIYHYIWHEFADIIIEESKPILNGSDLSKKQSRQAALQSLLKTSITILHPFMPFITEELWQTVSGNTTMLMIEPWPIKK